MSESIAKTDSRMVHFQKALAGRYKQFTSLLPKDFPEERFARMAINAVQAVPALLNCEPQSLWMALNNCAALGLEPNTALHEAVIVPRAGKAVFQPEYRAYIKLARNAGDDVIAGTVYDCDQIVATRGDSPRFEHAPALPWNRPKESKVVGYYAHVRRLHTGGTAWVLWSREEVEAHRDRYSDGYRRNPKESAWTTAFDRMAEKTMIHQLSRYLSKEVQRLARVEEALDTGMKVRPAADGEVEIVDPSIEDETEQALAAAEAAAEEPSTIDEAQAKLDRRREELRKQREGQASGGETTPNKEVAGPASGAPPTDNGLCDARRVGYDEAMTIVIRGERRAIQDADTHTNQGKAKDGLKCGWCHREIAVGEIYYGGERNIKGCVNCVEGDPDTTVPQAGPTEYPEEPKAAAEDGIAEDVEEIFGPDDGEDFPAAEAPAQKDVEAAPELFPKPQERLTNGQVSALMEAARAPGGRGETAFLTKVEMLDPNYRSLDAVPAREFSRLMKIAMKID
jgi:recombination protein RecT